MDLGLKGKTALVLGAAGGLGGAIARALAREGARVAVGDVNAESLARHGEGHRGGRRRGAPAGLGPRPTCPRSTAW